MIDKSDRPSGEAAANPDGDARPGEQGRAQVIVPLDPEFDLLSAFQSEEELSAGAALPAAVLEPPLILPSAPIATSVEATTRAATGERAVSIPPAANVPPAASVSSAAAVPIAATISKPPGAAASAATFAVSPFRAERVAADVESEPASRPSVSVADLLENNVRLDWQEAVAIAQHLCRTMAQDPTASIQRVAIEPWNVEITGTGDLQVLPGGTSSDPLVQQVGRVLRALLRDTIAPAELRLIAAQASFDVPVFATVEELANALRRFDRPGETAAIRTAFQKGVEAKFSTVSPDVGHRESALTHAVASEAGVTDYAPPSEWTEDRRPILVAAAVVLVSAVLLGLMLAVGVRFAGRSQLAANSTLPVQPIPLPPAHETGTSGATRPAPALPQARQPDGVRESGRHPAEPPRTPPAGSTSLPERAPAPTRLMPLKGGLAADEWRALALVNEGRWDEAAIIFDSIVLRNPAYRLSSDGVSADAVAIFRRSKQILVPSLARSHYDAARTAFDTEDYSRAIAETDKASALLDDPDVSPPEDLRDDVWRLRASAVAARTSLENRIYSSADADVLPPRPIGRQLPALQPPGSNAQAIGRLEILVDRTGQVETVRLHTPSNAYHDRMIVSAAKAWRYRPAVRNGKPVRFNLVLMINLPESE